MYHYSDVADWAKTKLSDNEVPLSTVAENIEKRAGRFELRQSKQVPNAWTVSDTSPEL
jgi:hypothetical protein